MDYSADEVREALSLFYKGENVRAYEIFGAHPVQRDGRNGIVFRVWAPNALSVSVSGSFNDWNEDSHYLRRLDSSSWELFVETADCGTSYKFCIETPWHEKIQKADPFGYFNKRRPDNASIVFDIEEYQWGDSEWRETQKTRDTLKYPMNIYELHFGSWRRPEGGGLYTYTELTDLLIPYLLEMGYNYIQLLPITEHPYGGSWGYQPTGYFAPTSRYGNPSEFMHFVDKLHQAGIGVIMDWVPSNFPKDTHGLVKFDGTSLFESDDPMLGERSSWGTCLFNFERSEVISFLISSANFWLGKIHLDGLRVGALSSMLFLDYGKSEGEWEPNKYGGKENLEAIDFVKRLNSAIHSECPGSLIFAEENTAWPKLTRKVEDGGLGFDYKWNMGWMKDMIHYMSLDPRWRPFNHDNLTYSFFYAFSENYLLPLSHDVVAHGQGSLISKMPGEEDERFAGLRAFITYMYAHPGKKLVFMGTEIGQYDEWDARGVLQWGLLSNKRHKQLETFFKKINKFYLENRPFFELDTIWKGFDWIHHDDYTNSVIAFKRTDSDGNEIIAVCNFRPETHEKYYVGVPKNGLYDEIFSSDDAEFGGSGITNGLGIKPIPMKIHGYSQGLELTLPPLGVIYLKCRE